MWQEGFVWVEIYLDFDKSDRKQRQKHIKMPWDIGKHNNNNKLYIELIFKIDPNHNSDFSKGCGQLSSKKGKCWSAANQ